MVKILILLFFPLLLRAQADKEVEYDTLEIEGKDSVEVEVEVEEEAIEAKETAGPSEVEVKQELNKNLDEALEEVEKNPPQVAPVIPPAEPIPEPIPEVPAAPVEAEIVEDKLEEPPPPQQEESIPINNEVEEKPFYGFLFDNSKKSLFKTESQWKGMSVGLGLMSIFPNTYQDSGSGGKIELDPKPVLQLGLEFGDVGKWSFLPNVFMVSPEKSRDGLMTEYVYGFGFDFAYNMRPWFRPRLGISTFFFSLKGERTGTEELRNGGDIDSFYITEGFRTSMLNTIDITLEFINKKYSVDLRTHIFSAFDSEKKNYAYGLHFNYFFDWKKDKAVEVVLPSQGPSLETNQEEVKDETL